MLNGDGIKDDQKRKTTTTGIRAMESLVYTHSVILVI